MQPQEHFLLVTQKLNISTICSSSSAEDQTQAVWMPWVRSTNKLHPYH